MEIFKAFAFKNNLSQPSASQEAAVTRTEPNWGALLSGRNAIRSLALAGMAVLTVLIPASSAGDWAPLGPICVGFVVVGLVSA